MLAEHKTILVFSLTIVVLGSSSVTAREMEMIGIRRDGKYAHFCGMQSGQPLFVKGMNYIRLRHGDHATFEAAVGSSPARPGHER